MSDAAMPDYLTTAEVAELLGVAVTSVRRYYTAGTMPAADRHYGQTPVWDRARIEAWQATRPGKGSPGRTRAGKDEDWWRSLDQDPIASADSLMEHAPDTARAVARYDAASVARVRRLLRDAYQRKTLRTDDVRAAIEGDSP